MTDAEIIVLRNEALARRDQYWVERCNDALDGDPQARIACAEALAHQGHKPQESASLGVPWRPRVPPPNAHPKRQRRKYTPGGIVITEFVCSTPECDETAAVTCDDDVARRDANKLHFCPKCRGE